MARDAKVRETQAQYSVRTQISLSPEQKAAIERVCRQEDISMSELIRRSVKHYLAARDHERLSVLEALRHSAGAWEGRTFTGVEYEDAIRQGAEERWRREVGDA